MHDRAELEYEMNLVSQAGRMMYEKCGTVHTLTMLLRFSVEWSGRLYLSSWNRSHADECWEDVGLRTSKPMEMFHCDVV